MKKMRLTSLVLVAALWLLLAGFLWLGGRDDYSLAERRKLAQAPALTGKTLFDGSFMGKFEDFTLDQFPLRDHFRQVKSLFHYYVLNQKDNNGIYLVGDTVAKLEYPLNKTSVNYATGRMGHLYDTYLAGTDSKCYAAMIPDKGCYLAAEKGYPAMDYDALQTLYWEALPWAQPVDLMALLSAEDYYRTDTHWRQERLLPVAQRLCEIMGAEGPQAADYTQTALEAPFYGVYFGQAALPMEPETLYVLQSPVLEGCVVTDLLTGKTSHVYDMEKRDSPDLYDVFLSGAQPLLQVENPAGEAGKELVLFRDSYGSSLAPLLLQGYSKITLVDIRYIHPDQVGQYLTFHGQDVLFLYSSLILNSGRSLK